MLNIPLMAAAVIVYYFLCYVFITGLSARLAHLMLQATWTSGCNVRYMHSVWRRVVGSGIYSSSELWRFLSNQWKMFGKKERTDR